MVNSSSQLLIYSSKLTFTDLKKNNNIVNLCLFPSTITLFTYLFFFFFNGFYNFFYCCYFNCICFYFCSFLSSFPLSYSKLDLAVQFWAAIEQTLPSSLMRQRRPNVYSQRFNPLYALLYDKTESLSLCR